MGFLYDSRTVVITTKELPFPLASKQISCGEQLKSGKSIDKIQELTVCPYHPVMKGNDRCCC